MPPEVTEEEIEERVERRTEGIDADAEIERGSLTITASVIPEFRSRYEKEDFAVTGSVEEADELVDEIVENVRDFRIDMNKLQKFQDLIKRPPAGYEEWEEKQEESPTEVLEEVKDWYEQLVEVAPTRYQRRKLAKGAEEMEETIESRRRPERKPPEKKAGPLGINLSKLSRSLNSELTEKDYVNMSVENIILDTVRGKLTRLPARPSFSREEGDLYAVWARPFREGRTLRISAEDLSSNLALELNAFSPLSRDELEETIEPWLVDTLKTVGSPEVRDSTIAWSPGETGETMTPAGLPERAPRERKPAVERRTVEDFEEEIRRRMGEL